MTNPTLQSKALDHEARALLREALRNYDDRHGVGSMSPAVYDTAWVSLVTKHVGGSRQWLFPECFRFLLRTQLDDGGWESCVSEVDGILNTAASLLSLKRHAAEPLQMRDLPHAELDRRIEKAVRALDSKLAVWDVAATAHVGFEMIVPSLLGLLEREALFFTFRGKETLLQIHASKMSRFRSSFLYTEARTTALHSLEAFVGTVDFDRVAHHKMHGAMMASPSSTAAFMLHTSTWHDDAENYLRHVVCKGPGRGNGGVPSAYPSTYFELSWIVSTLVKSGCTAAALESPELTKARHILTECFEKEGGTIGFAPGVGSDADDTAKGLLTLKLLGLDVSPDKMIGEFEAGGHFRTYASERDPSLSANCNVLLALLHMDGVSRYGPQILKCTRFICNSWWENDGAIKDKWNLSYLYPSMLMVEALVDLLAVVEKGRLPGLVDQELKSKISVALCQACIRVMLQQRDDGSWNASLEQTSYAVLTLVHASRLAFLQPIKPEVESAVERGRAFLLSANGEYADHIWIEKVTYASPLLSKTYSLAALKASEAPEQAAVGHVPGDSGTAGAVKANRLVDFYRRTPLFAGAPPWQLRASLVEASLFLPLLRARHLDIFPREGMEEDKYFEMIPFTWVGCNNRALTFASASFLYDMMVISLLNYQADEFMEAVAGPSFCGNLAELRGRIGDMFAARERATANPRKRSFQTAMGEEEGREPCMARSGQHASTCVHTRRRKPEAAKGDALAPLTRFVDHVLSHPAVAGAGAMERAQVQRELRVFLLAHVSQAEDNARFSGPDACWPQGYHSLSGSFFDWVRTTSADHTSCPYSFALVCAMLGKKKCCFETAEQRYFAGDVCRHLSTMCRMYNDFGSTARDRAEGNLNSIDFAEFAAKDGADEAKASLFALAEYERQCLGASLARLDDACGAGKREMDVLRLFCDVTDLYGQIYVVRDMGTRMTQARSGATSGEA